MEIMPHAGVVIVQLLIFGLFALSCFAFWIWMIVDCVNNEPREGNDRVIWLLIIILLHFVGAVVYFFARRPTRMATYGR